MFAQQYGSSWSKYLIWSTLAALFFSFGISPGFQFFGIKAYYNWNFIYFFFLVMAVAITSRVTIQIVEKTVQVNSTHFSSSKNFFPIPQPTAKHLPEVKENDKDANKN